VSVIEPSFAIKRRNG